METKRNTSYIRNIKCSDVYAESQVDYSLPDFLGDVRKILFTEAALRPSGRFVGGDEVELSGVVVYKVVYSDSEGNLSSAEFTSDYDYSVKCSADCYKDSVCDTKISAYSIRLVGPRKISARSSLVGSVRLSEEAALSVSGSAFDGDHMPEVSTKTVNIRCSQPSSVNEREFAEEITRLDGVIADEVSVVYSNAEIAVDSVSAEDGLATVKGKLRLVCCVRIDDQPAYSVEKSINVEESVNFDGLKSDMKLIPELTVTSLKSTVNPDETGCAIVMNAIVEYCILGEGNDSLELVTDGYLKTCATENSYESFNYQLLSDLLTFKESHSAEIMRGEVEGENIREIILMSATPKVESVECHENLVTICGEVRYSGVASDLCEDKILYIPVKFSSPFCINVNNDCQNCENIQAEVRLSARAATASLDPTKLYVGCVLEGSVTLSCDLSERVLSSSHAKEGEVFMTAGCSITVYYPTDEDTLFSVAKRFHTSCLKVARDNDISERVFASENPEGKLTGIKKLLIY